jgi:hypothetical protein
MVLLQRLPPEALEAVLLLGCLIRASIYRQEERVLMEDAWGNAVYFVVSG